MLAEDVPDVELILTVLFRQKSISYQNLGARNLFGESGYRDFVTRMSTNYLKGKFVYLCALFVGDRMRATYLCSGAEPGG